MKQAFSVLEFVFVMVIVGFILAIAKFFYTKDDLLMGANAILNDIRYTRTLALIQESFRIPNTSLSVAKDEWFKSRWQIYFIRSKSATNNEQTYTIFLDKNGDGNANIGKINENIDREIGVDILNSKKLMNSGQSGVISKDDERASKRFNIEQSYGIERVEFKGSCTGSTRIIFDEFGRLYSPLRSTKRAYDKTLALKSDNCIIKLSNKAQKSVCIVIENASGYAYIPKFQNTNTQLVLLKNKQQACSKL
ncbi:Tfp pilus assembly protein FimT/FimU [Campylobacter sp. US33a]|uniref:pilus assembly FimT family protein n=1 Tax=Campylobacter sp. US33a TaxID=2498120 RepID=UPI00106734D5|nr:prepilin-type cleavage/methylation domain-containing protein [Campylobacter sp. US33a]TEY00495.1 prepilin-type cleavage/methylation domain-containing protein [Campylobacter sp. US33a]